ncbi:hypothetical protein SAMN04487905_105249 [Actinopolyspora xinjiangensis]|uniref:Uncharacterized protein n=1 Tax=Actinopolyspora xinjiangensis TaxID=405564 RepID=A0A1H0TS48_9ACTN|nr:hypothetical protein SAMN04487905_105249 [Actinopolyspora xinjiangensis]
MFPDSLPVVGTDSEAREDGPVIRPPPLVEFAFDVVDRYFCSRRVR